MINETSINNGFSKVLFFIVIYCLSFLIIPNSYGQVTPFQKSVLDSLEANDFNLSVAFAFNVSQDGTSTLTTGTDIGMMYSTRRSNYQIAQSSYFNRLESFSTSNRFAAMLSGSIFSHDTIGKKLVEKRWYPEPFIFYSFDANRGINYRMQLGLNAVFALKPTNILRMKFGAGLLYEKENWQMIKSEQLPYMDTFPIATQKYIFDTVGVTKDGKLYRDNLRANVYANLICRFAKNVSLNAFFDVQMPFEPPYYNIPQKSVFPVVTKRYPRINLSAQLSISIWKKLSFITAFVLQSDKGQIPLYVPNVVYSLNQGLQLSL
jgi:hypothetical protein